jgi:hypothetical protein
VFPAVQQTVSRKVYWLDNMHAGWIRMQSGALQPWSAIMAW